MTVATFIPRAEKPPRAAGSEIPGGEALESIARRVRNEYLEMPGLSLTLGQAQRMWHLHQVECEILLGALVSSGFLKRTTGGAFVRAGSGSAGV